MTATSVPAWFSDRPALDEAPWPTVEELLEELEHLSVSAATCPHGVAEAWRLEDAALLEELGSAYRALTVAQSRVLGLLAEVERREATVHEHGMATSSWLAAGTTHSARAARGEVLLARSLAEHPVVGDALGAGGLSLEQAAVIAQGLDRLPGDLDRGEREEVARHLVALAGEFNPPALRRLVNHAVAVVAPDVAEEHDRRTLTRAERAQQVSRHVAWRTDPDDGALRFWGKLPAVEGELFRQHLSAIASARRASDASMGVETSQGQALADALALTIGHHASCQGGPVKGGDHARVVVTVGLAELRAGVGAATLVGSDEQVTAGEARRLACSAGVLPAVLGGASVPLDLGRSQRFFNAAQRLALALRDRGCAFPGCDRPPSDCEAHHAVDPWQAGGRTDVADGVLLCPAHHHTVEPDLNRPPGENWQITFDARGGPVFQAPQRRDGTRVSRQHHRYRQHAAGTSAT